MLSSCPLQNISNCTLGKCLLSCAQVEYQPAIVANSVYAVAFGLLCSRSSRLGLNTRLGDSWSAWSAWSVALSLRSLAMPAKSCCMATHLNSTVSAYIIYSPQPLYPFQAGWKGLNSRYIYLVPLTIALAFLASSLYVCLCRIIIFHSQQISCYRPRAYAITLMARDPTSLIIRGAGGGLAATANTVFGSEIGRVIMVAGVVF